MTNSHPIMWFIYDGECPICNLGASLSEVRKTLGELRTLDARTEHQHPIVQSAINEGMKLDEGMVIYYKNHFYQGREAAQLLAHSSRCSSWFTKLNYQLFKTDSIAKISYPVMKKTRKILLMLRRVPPL